jgi:predicted nuclease of restriction endonuclease-like (RecB) superfamily
MKEIILIVDEVKKMIEQARERAVRSVNHERTLLYWHIGKRIFEEEQQGKEKADYGDYLIKSLSTALTPLFGIGYSIRQLELSRQLFRTYPIANAVRSQLSWTHYKILLRIDNQDKREFYETETVKNNWPYRVLERQINSQLFERPLASSDRKSVLEVARQEKEPEKPTMFIKDPLYLEFLGLKPEATYYEKDLEQAIITHLQAFMLELGNGFSFVARQRRIHLDGDDFFVDLVFYNRLLRCFVLIEIKIGKLTHQDIGQLQMYVNYYDRIEKNEQENNTVGILLCAQKNDAVVKFSLPLDNQQIVASKYQLYLPTEKQLLEEVKKEIEQFDQKKENNTD